MSGKFKVQCGVESFGFLGPNGEESSVVAYGEVASLLYEGDIYNCVLDHADMEEKDIMIERVLESVTVPKDVEYIVYEGEEAPSDDEEEEGDDGDEEEGEDDEEEEEEAVGPELVE